MVLVQQQWTAAKRVTAGLVTAQAKIAQLNEDLMRDEEWTDISLQDLRAFKKQRLQGARSGLPSIMSS